MPLLCESRASPLPLSRGSVCRVRVCVHWWGVSFFRAFGCCGSCCVALSCVCFFVVVGLTTDRCELQVEIQNRRWNALKQGSKSTEHGQRISFFLTCIQSTKKKMLSKRETALKQGVWASVRSFHICRIFANYENFATKKNLSTRKYLSYYRVLV